MRRARGGIRKTRRRSADLTASRCSWYWSRSTFWSCCPGAVLYPAAGGAGDWRHDARIAAFIVAMVALIACCCCCGACAMACARRGALRASEAQLRDSSRYRTLVAAMDEGVLLVDAQGAAIAFNDSAGASSAARASSWRRPRRLYKLRGTPEADATMRLLARCLQCAPIPHADAAYRQAPRRATMSCSGRMGRLHGLPSMRSRLRGGARRADGRRRRCDITAEGTASSVAPARACDRHPARGRTAAGADGDDAKIGSWRLSIGIDGRPDRWMSPIDCGASSTIRWMSP
jgi:PAS domain-containing protein